MDAKKDFPFPTKEKHEPQSDRVAPVEFEPTEEAIDKGIAESFPASDPLSVTAAKAKTDSDPSSNDRPRTDPDARERPPARRKP
jgi:hypothetical protein